VFITTVDFAHAVIVPKAFKVSLHASIVHLKISLNLGPMIGCSLLPETEKRKEFQMLLAKGLPGCFCRRSTRLGQEEQLSKEGPEAAPFDPKDAILHHGMHPCFPLTTI